MELVKDLKLSAVIPTRCRSRDLIIAIRTIIDQERSPEQLIIVDQTPSLESKDAVDSLLKGLESPFELKYIHDPGISGLVEAKACAIEYATGDIVSFLEDDIELFPDYFVQVESFFRNYPHALGCGGVVVEVGCYSSLYRWFFRLIHRGIFFDPRVMLHAQENSNETPIESRYISGGVSSYRKEVFAEVPFDVVNGFFALEDIELSTRAADHFGDRHFFINPKIRLRHNMSPANRAVMGVVWERKMREFVLFYKKHADKPNSFLHLVILLSGLFAVSTLASLKKLSFSPLIGFFLGVKNGLSKKLRSIPTASSC